MDKTLTIDIVSDVICPWCYIGKRRLEKALDGLEGPCPKIRWRPFLLDNAIPKQGMARAKYLERKFGSTERIASIYAPLAAAGRAEGIEFAFDRIAVTPNTLDAHRLIRWAEAAGSSDTVAETLFRRYWEDAADIGDPAVLLQIAVDAGLDGDLVAQLLRSEADLDAVMAEINQAFSLGITGVPTFIIANRYAVIGAQGPEVLRAAITRAELESRAGAGA